MYPSSFPPPTTSLKPRRLTARPVDPVAVVVGNASLLGIGYMFMRRPRLAAAAVTGAVFFGFALALDPGAVFWRILLALWWSATIVHSWWLTRHPADERPLVDIDDPDPTWRSRVFAVGVTGLVLVSFMGLRLDAWLIVQSAAQVHEDGDCEQAIVSLEELGATHRIAYGSTTAAGEADLEACRMLVTALDQQPDVGAETLESYLKHPGARWEGAGPKRAELLLTVSRIVDHNVEAALKAAFTQLSVTVKETPGESGNVREVVEAFVSDLGAEISDCRAKKINDWLYARSWGAPEISDPIAAASGNVPDRMLDCARARFDADDFEEARKVYKQFLSEFPDHRQADKAADELYKVESAIERKNVNGLLESEEYCDAPAPYRGAEPYKGKGPHEMRMFGLSADEHDFPKSWTTRDVDDTVLAVCVDGPSRGSFQQSCLYESPMAPYGATKVDFYASKFKIKAYEVKTGERVASYTKEIGDPCPAVLKYETYGVDIGPPDEVESDYTDKAVRSMFQRLMD
ncbi:MAG: tetratricopeptide repeat protein [Stackebrandtia sp.]